MEEKQFRAYFQLLTTLAEQLEHLTDLTRLKAKAAQNDDLLALDEVLRQEQAAALNFRGLEQRRQKQTVELGIAELALSQLPECCPASLQPEAQGLVENLTARYRTYRSVAEDTRVILEKNLREVEQILEQAGVPSEESTPGYTAPPPETPPNMKTDFRA